MSLSKLEERYYNHYQSVYNKFELGDIVKIPIFEPKYIFVDSSEGLFLDGKVTAKTFNQYGCNLLVEIDGEEFWVDAECVYI